MSAVVLEFLRSGIWTDLHLVGEQYAGGKQPIISLEAAVGAPRACTQRSCMRRVRSPGGSDDFPPSYWAPPLGEARSPGGSDDFPPGCWIASSGFAPGARPKATARRGAPARAQELEYRDRALRALRANASSDRNVGPAAASSDSKNEECRDVAQGPVQVETNDAEDADVERVVKKARLGISIGAAFARGFRGGAPRPAARAGGVSAASARAANPARAASRPCSSAGNMPKAPPVASASKVGSRDSRRMEIADGPVWSEWFGQCANMADYDARKAEYLAHPEAYVPPGPAPADVQLWRPGRAISGAPGSFESLTPPSLMAACVVTRVGEPTLAMSQPCPDADEEEERGRWQRRGGRSGKRDGKDWEDDTPAGADGEVPK